MSNRLVGDDVTIQTVMTLTGEINKMILNEIIPARDILKLFIGKYGKGMKYEHFKNQIVDEMKTRDVIPDELNEVLSRILQISHSRARAG